MSVEKAKAGVRERVNEIRRGFKPAWVAEASRVVLGRLLKLKALHAARSIGCYLSTPREVWTRPLIERCWHDSKNVCVPAFDEVEKRYRMAWLVQDAKLALGPEGIPQPDDPNWVPANALEIVIVPGLAFDRKGHRLGHGSGHYDRLLAECGGRKVGLAFEAQMVDELPTGPLDVPMDAVVTEKDFYLFAGRTREGT
ncbi:MAG TPA: 5-formyltetrahydrofolate cyclo-ligase [Kiritimatiellia bacterium]|nr:5-formyltetrahydrofolate cyclo-ligase [Kiritimatiellia bacterium]